MSPGPIFSKTVSAGVMGLLFLTAIIAAGAEKLEAKPLALRGIMREMGRNLQVITDGISREDWALVSQTAPLIADHPQPPWIEKARILKFAGTDAGKFKGHDKQTHLAALELVEAATRQDGPAVIEAFAKVQTSCLDCHQSFRRSFQAHFYGAPHR